MGDRIYVREVGHPWRSDDQLRHFQAVRTFRHIQTEGTATIELENVTYTLRALTNHMIECTSPQERQGRPFLLLHCTAEQSESLLNGNVVEDEDEE
jgi:hypothetical protein